MKLDPAPIETSKRILLHICCSGCAVHPVEALRTEGLEVVGTFWNPNIHPWAEYQARKTATLALAQHMDLRLLGMDAYGLKDFLREVVYREHKRCSVCIHMRLLETAKRARTGGFQGFSTTMLSSSHMDHDRIRSIGESIQTEIGVPFTYRDFRTGWQRGVEVTRSLQLYRQRYCGCVYSEFEK